MFVRSSSILAVVFCAPTLVLAQSHHHHGAHLSGYRYGTSSYSVGSTFVGTPGFSAGVVTPYPLGIGAVPYPIVTGYGAGGWYAPPYGYGTFGYGGLGYRYGYALPPVVIPAETMYGPGPVRRMMGLDPPLGTPVIQQTTVVAPQANNGNGFGVLAPQPGGARPNVRASNAQTLARAKKQVENGDVLFAAQKYADALASYSDAARTAPDLADAYFRKAAADIALARYDDAVSAIKFGLQLAPTWVDGPFRFSALYGGNVLAEQSHRDVLDRAVASRPTSDLLFLSGVVRYFGEHPKQSETYFQKASVVAVGNSSHLDLFLKRVAMLPPDPSPPATPPVQAAKPNVDDLLVPGVVPQGPAAPPVAKPADVNGRDI